ncbi:2',5'-phosphodiesterase 12-like [Coccinella septempunctata]|uniref:2',5'-phosphodiesterase 12-like n=1 Tax=Coccinella septempunctata TaxID=41139 RepID=UPI001D079E7C|nr:2',5'-phosphodiesterase 12-like [Coccinella septempunctata]
MEKIIHLRYNSTDKKFQLSIPLKLNFQNVEIDEDIETECSASETIGLLLERTKDEIKNKIHHKSKEIGSEVKIENDDIEIYLRRKRKEGYKIIPDYVKILSMMSQDHSTSRLTIFDQEFGVCVNAPKIMHLSIPPVLYAPYSIRYARIGGLNIKAPLCKFKWYRSKDKIDWEEVGEGVSYPIKLDDIGYFLKMKCFPFSSKGIEGSPAEVVSEGVVVELTKIPQCPFHFRHTHTKITLSGQSYRVVSYNALSSLYNREEDFSYCPDEFMVMNYRKQLILREILGYNADIVCLQEIDLFEYQEFFQQELENEGYLTKFYRKGFYLGDGLMCAVRKSRFKLKAYEQIVFCNAIRSKEIFQNLYDILKTDKKLFKRFSLQSTSLQVFEIKCKDKRILLIGNTQMSHRPDNDDTRLIHAYMTIRYLNSLKQRLLNMNETFKVNIVLCGDFNSLPNSAVYKFICDGKVEPEDYLKVGDRLLNLQHNMRFVSACGSPKYTVYTPSFKNCIDYVFIEEDTEVEQVVPFLEEEVEKHEGLPNDLYPSDHLALVVDIKFKD